MTPSGRKSGSPKPLQYFYKEIRIYIDIYYLENFFLPPRAYYRKRSFSKHACTLHRFAKLKKGKIDEKKIKEGRDTQAAKEPESQKQRDANSEYKWIKIDKSKLKNIKYKINDD